MILTTAFDLMQEVLITAIDQEARILKIQYEGSGIIYDVEYWFNGKKEYVWCHERELLAMKDMKPKKE